MSKLFQPLDPLKPAELPDKPLPNWKMWGPGAVLVGLSIGAGELIIWPRLMANHGAGMAWAAMLGVLIQMWVNFEVGRWTIATGETIYTGFCRVWHGFGPLFIMFNILGWIVPGWARSSGLALKSLTVGSGGFGGDTFWTVVTFLGVALMLFGPRVVYKSVEKSIEILIIVITLGLVLLAIGVGTADSVRQMGEGLVNIGHFTEGISAKELFSAVVFAGAGGTANLFYSFYLRDKHIGMGARLPSLTNPLRDREEKVPATGFIYSETPENQSRFRKWWGYIRQDQVIFFWFLNSFTMMLFMFVALTVLHPLTLEAGKPIITDKNLVATQAEQIGLKVGGWGTTVYLLVGFATLFSTQITILDGACRSIADIIYTNFKGAQKRSVGWWYVLIVGVWIFVGCGLTALSEFAWDIKELGFLVNAAYMGGFAMAVFVPLTLYINYRHLPKSARPGWLCTTMMTAAAIVYVSFAVYCITLTIMEWLS